MDQLASLVVSLVVLAICISHLGLVSGLLAAFLRLLWPLALIWFSEELGSLTGLVRGHYIDSETPPSIVKLFGWIVLLVVVAASWKGVFLR